LAKVLEYNDENFDAKSLPRPLGTEEKEYMNISQNVKSRERIVTIYRGRGAQFLAFTYVQ